MDKYTEYLKIGSIENGVVNREWFSQGWIFKDEEAYINDKDKPCYVPELSDEIYTGNDFLRLCKGQEDFADELFEEVDWQCPESLMCDWLFNDEWVECEGCGKLFNTGYTDGKMICPYCGKDNE